MDRTANHDNTCYRTCNATWHDTRHATCHFVTFDTRRVKASISCRNIETGIEICPIVENESGARKWRLSSTVSGEDILDHHPRDIRQPEIAAVEAVGQALVVESKQVQEGRVQVVDADAIDDRLVPKLVGLAVVHAALGPAAGQP